MPLTLDVDVEALVREYLIDVPDVAALVDDRVADAVPADVQWPFVTLFQVTDRKLTGMWQGGAWFNSHRVQIDARAETKEDAWTVAATIQAALEQLKGETARGVVATVQIDSGPGWTPDPQTAQPGYRMQVLVFAHPLP